MLNRGLRLLLLSLWVGGLTVTPSLLQAETPGDGRATIQYVGSSTIGKFISRADKVYPGASFTIEDEPESLGGERCAIDNTCQLGGVAREVSHYARVSGVESSLIGYDAVAAVVNNRNPVRNLTREQLAGIFTGVITNWSEVGGEDRSIVVYTVRPESATYHVFRRAVLREQKYAGTRSVRLDRHIIPRVMHDRDAIGQISLAFLKKQRKMVHPLFINREKPSADNAAYPITRPLYLVTHGKPTESVQDFIDWTLGSEGQTEIKHYFVGVD